MQRGMEFSQTVSEPEPLGVKYRIVSTITVAQCGRCGNGREGILFGGKILRVNLTSGQI